MTREELVAQIAVCKRRARNAQSFVAAFKTDPKSVDINKVRYWEAEMNKQLGYVRELEDELDEMDGIQQRPAA